jgi:hypothetical protein
MFCKKNKRICNREPNKIWFWALVVALFFGAVSYGYFVRGTIVNVVARQSMQTEITALDTAVLDLESQYIKAKNSVTYELAEQLGFVTVTNQKFVTRNTANLGLSLVTPER